MSLNNEFYEQVSNKVIKKYYACMKDFLVSYQGKITEADAVVNIINVSLTVSINIFYSMKDFLPFATFDKELLTKSFVERMEKALLEFNLHKDVNHVNKEESISESS